MMEVSMAAVKRCYGVDSHIAARILSDYEALTAADKEKIRQQNETLLKAVAEKARLEEELASLKEEIFELKHFDP